MIRVELRRPDACDRDVYLRWARDQDFQTWLAPPAPVPSDREVDRWLAGAHSFAIYELPDRRLVGGCALDRTSDDGDAELGIWIADPADRGRGLGGAALGLLIAHGFHSMGLRRIHLGTYSTNVPAIAAFKRAGFRVYETVPHIVHRRGEWWDGVMMELYR